jgi:hypothetical protein
MKSIQAKLGAIALSSVLLFGSMTACSGPQVAQDIVNWTPTIISTANTVASVVSSLAPQDAAVVGVAVTGFDAAAQLVSNQAQAYLANPSATTLGQLQAQVLTFQQQVNASLLAAAKITNTKSQQTVIVAIQGLATALTAVLGLISTIKGNTISPAAVTAVPVTLSQVMPLMNHQQMVAQVAEHYGESDARAEAQIELTYARLAAAGL